MCVCVNWQNLWKQKNRLDWLSPNILWRDIRDFGTFRWFILFVFFLSTSDCLIVSFNQDRPDSFAWSYFRWWWRTHARNHRWRPHPPRLLSRLLNLPSASVSSYLKKNVRSRILAVIKIEKDAVILWLLRMPIGYNLEFCFTNCEPCSGLRRCPRII